MPGGIIAAESILTIWIQEYIVTLTFEFKPQMSTFFENGLLYVETFIAKYCLLKKSNEDSIIFQYAKSIRIYLC